MDEHDPAWSPDEDPQPSGFWGFLKSLVTAVVMGVGAALVGAFLVGCDSAELDRLEQIALTKERFFRGCMPRKGDTVTAYWTKGELICSRVTPTGRYGKTFPHAEVRIAEVEL